MARSRNIKPEFFTNDQVADNCPLGRLLFIGLWTLADYKGDLEWKERTVKIKILPWDNCDLKKIAINLDISGLIRFYSDGIKIYINIPNFNKHQNPHKNEREKGSDIPAYSEQYRQAVDLIELEINRDKSRVAQECSQSDPADSLLLIPDSLLLIPDSRLSADASCPAVPAEPEFRLGDSSQEIAQQAKAVSSDVLRIFGHWQTRMNHPTAKLDDKRKKIIQNSLKLGYSADDLIFAIDGCAKSPHHMGQNESGTVYDSVELIFRSADKIDGFIKRNLIPAGGPNGPSYKPPSSNVERLVQRARAEANNQNP